MAYLCFVCELQSATISGHCMHIRLMHPTVNLSKYYCCHCPKTYETLQCLRKHLKSKHPDDQPLLAQPVHEPEPELVEPGVVVNIDEVDFFNEENLENEVVNNVNLPGQPSVEAFQTALYDCTLVLAAKLYSVPSLNRSRIQEILNLTSDFTSSGFLDVLENKVNFMLRDYQGPQKDLHDLKCMFSSMHESLLGLETERKRLNAFKDSNCFVQPEAFYIGVGEVLKFVNGQRTRIPVNLNGQYINVPSVLKKFFELPGVFQATINNIQKLQNSETFTNLIQSPLWEKIERECFPNRLVIPLVFYFDDAEPNNQTGSHSGDNSLGLIYYFVPCLPQHLLSQLEYIFVASVFLTDHQKRRNEETFRILVNDLKMLETTCIEIQINDVIHTVFFAVALIIGDNKGVNGITGFVECFRANHFCRLCKVHRDVTETQTRENIHMLRDPLNYDADVTLDDVPSTGIKRKCIWNELLSYHCTVNRALDLMHDFFEGICHYDLSLILLCLIDRQYFTLETLNDRVKFFDFGIESGNRVTLITMEHLRKDKFKMSASEMFCFARNLGLMIGDLVPEGNEYWSLYIKLVEILDIVTAPFFERDSAVYLTTLIAEHHQIYLNVFNQRLKPKFHLALHIPRIMLDIGPLINVWCMRMEGKHRPVVKIPANSQPNRVNPPLTIAMRYSLSLAAKFLGEKSFPPEVIFHTDESLLRNAVNFNDFREVLPDGYADGISVKNVNICGTLYDTGMVLVFTYQHDLPVFGRIEHFVKPLGEEKCFFILKAYKTVGYSDHMHCFAVRPPNAHYFISYDDLVSFYPTKCRVGCDNNLYITFRHVL
ncbi:Major inner capsid protein VP3 [Frankliniella fusca]|uniref:Major inner capsid protein VP3 n=1 Tax=Frankliniella fusca TaxID=407009 RepID=A0AAE1HY00_9NEOP|nr:Major inner capsid protein VP3 [Frankliniella fusca]